MPEFAAGQTHRTTAAEISVENLPEGRHTFELRVEDDSGNLSLPDRVVVVVVARGEPPRVTSFTPDFGRPQTRVVMRVAGVVSDDFAADHEVEFNGVKAPVTGGSSRTIHTLVPEGATSGPLALITRHGRGESRLVFHVPQSLLLPWPGPSAPAFGPEGALLAALDPEGRRVGIWKLEAAAAEPDRPAAEVELGSRASRLLWLATPDFSGFLAWHPGSTLAHHVVPGEEEAKGRRLPGRAVDIQSPAAGLGTGAAGLFLQPNGGTAAALLAEAEQPWKPLDAQAPRALSLSPNGRRLALATGEKQLLRFALPTGRLAETLNADDIEQVDRVFIGDAGGIWALGNRGSLGALARNDRVTVLDLGLRVESAGVPARGHRLFAAGDDQNVLLTVSARPDNGVDRLISRPIELPHTAQGLHALAHSPDGLHVAVLHPEENSLSFVSGRTLRRTVTLPLDFLGGGAFTGGGKLPAAAASPGGEHWAFASELGIIVLESGSVVP